MHDELSVVEFDGDEAVAEADGRAGRGGPARAAACSGAPARLAGGLGVAMALLGGGASPARARAARRRTTSRSSTTR